MSHSGVDQLCRGMCIVVFKVLSEQYVHRVQLLTIKIVTTQLPLYSQLLYLYYNRRV